jgi:hypothetical protein
LIKKKTSSHCFDSVTFVGWGWGGGGEIYDIAVRDISPAGFQSTDSVMRLQRVMDHLEHGCLHLSRIFSLAGFLSLFLFQPASFLRSANLILACLPIVMRGNPNLPLFSSFSYYPVFLPFCLSSAPSFSYLYYYDTYIMR